MKLYGPFGAVSHGGVTYTPAPDGSFDVPREAAPTLLELGFTHAPPATATVAEPAPELELPAEPEPAAAPPPAAEPAPAVPRRRRRGA